MPTDNPKISAYVPQLVYDRFRRFQEERKLSMSQAAIVVFAEYFGLEQTIKEITAGTTIGGITLERFELLETKIELLETKIEELEKVKELELKIKELEKEVEIYKTTSNPLFENSNSQIKKQQKKSSNIQLNLQNDLLSIDSVILGIRLNISRRTIIGNSVKSTEWFTKWTKDKDPDNIAWESLNVGTEKKKVYGYVPTKDTPNELLSRLKNWLKEISVKESEEKDSQEISLPLVAVENLPESEVVNPSPEGSERSGEG